MARSFMDSNEHINPFSDKHFTKLFDKFYAPLCRYCMKMVMDSNAAEDIVQDVFLNLWKDRNRLGHIKFIKTYLFRSVKNRSINYFQQQLIKNRYLPTDEDHHFRDYQTVPTANELLECKELESIIEKALANLPDKCRTIFLLKRFGDMSNLEIANHLNLSVKTIEAQMTIAIKKLTHYIDFHWNSK